MSTAEILSLVSLISYIVAGICLALAVFFWFFFKIPSVVGDLSGRTAKKSIEKMRQANERTGNKSYRVSTTNAARGKLTDPMQPSSKLNQARTSAQQPKAESSRPETGLLAENKAESVLGEETAALDCGETTGMLIDDDATVVLDEKVAPANRTGGKKLTMLQEVMLIHTDEVIS